MKSLSINFLALILASLLVSLAAVSVSAETSSMHQTQTRMTCLVPSAYKTIQAAVDDTNCLEISVAAGTYGDPVLIDRTVTIRGASRATTIITNQITGQHPSNFGISVTLEQLTVQNSPNYGIYMHLAAILNANDITVTGNTNWGIYSANTTVTLSNCESSYNKGGIWGRIVSITNCSVHNNPISGGLNVGSGTIRDSSITDNSETIDGQKGGGISISFTGAGSLTIENSTIRGNTCNGPDATSNTCDGGGIALIQGSLELRNSTVTLNVADRYGGGVHVHYLWESSAVIENSIISNNTANDSGGGVSVAQPTIIRNSVIEGNTAYADTPHNDNGIGAGGGIYVYDNTLEMSDTTVRDNQARPFADGVGASSGGGLYVVPSAGTGVTVTTSTLSGNYAFLDGGGAYITEGTYFENVTVAENRASRDGGGIYGHAPGFIHHSTIADNDADFGGDGVGNGGGLAGNTRVYHTWIGHNRDNTLTGTQYHDCTGNTLSLGYSLLREIGSCTGFAVFASDQVGNTAVPLKIDPILPLASHGGPTETIALKETSIAIDAGWNRCTDLVLTDQRGATRVGQDGNSISGDGNYCDIGAFEVAPDYVPTRVAVSSQQSANSQQLWSVIGGLSLLFLLTLIAIKLDKPKL